MFEIETTERSLHVFNINFPLTCLNEIQTECKIIFNVLLYTQNVLLEVNTFFL